MTFSSCKPHGALRWVTCATIIGLTSGSAEAGEKIRFSGRRNALELPAWKEQLPGPALGSSKLALGGASEALAIPTTGPTTTAGGPDSRQLDLLERRKNWMFQTAEPGKAATSETFDRKNDETARGEGRPKTSIDRFWDDRTRQTLAKKEPAAKDMSGNKERDPSARFSPQREFKPGAGAERERADDPAPTAAERREAGLPDNDRETRGGSVSGADLKEPKSLNRLTTERRDQQREQQRETQLADFGKLITPGAAGAPGRGADAFRAGGDTTRAGVNLIGGNGAPDFTRRNDFLGAGAALPGLAGPRFSGRDDFSPGRPGGNAVLPEPQRPAENLRVQPKPTILEIPRRKI